MPTTLEMEMEKEVALLGRPPLGVRSTWASKPVTLSGTFTPGEWTGAGVMSMPDGFIWVKNDANFLYLALDLVKDTGKSPGVGDYFWLSFDVDRDHTITAKEDVNYGIYPSLPVRLGRQFYLGPGTWTGILPGPSASAVQQGFGATPKSATPHRIWELKIAFSEIGVTLSKSTLPVLRFGLRVSSTTPSFTTDFPPSFYANFTALHEIYLATSPEVLYPLGTEGPVIAGVGLIPFTTIAGGRATTAASYNPHVVNAAFGGVVNFTYNRPNVAAAWAAGARRYKILHRAGTTGTFVALRRNWTNYRWTGSTFVLESFGPDAQDRYELKDPSLDYSTKDLLFQMDTAGWTGAPALATGLHEWQVNFFKDDGSPVKVPAQTLQLFVDNTLPEVQILDVTYKGASVAPCSIVNIDEASPEPVKVRFRAYDAEGDLNSFTLQAYYGGPSTSPMDLVPGGVVNYPGSGLWNGVTNQSIDAPMAPKRFPPVSCAYQIRLGAYARVTDGYHYTGYAESDYHATFQRPGVAPFALAKALEVPFGLAVDPERRGARLG